MKGWRILYHSTNKDGLDTIVSGLVAIPDQLFHQGERKVIAWGHPTTGIAPRCAPSVGYDPFDTVEGLRDLVDAGYVVVATDYEGMGFPGGSSFLIGDVEARNMIDIVRAAQNMPQTQAGNDVVFWGHSQGGHAALFATQKAPSYAPELNVRGVATAAPATNLGELLSNHVGDVSGVTIGSYAFHAYSQVYNTPVSTILTPAAAEIQPAMINLCLLGQNAQLHTIARPVIGDFIKSNPATTLPWSRYLSENSPSPSTPLNVPAFIAQGQTDELVTPSVTKSYADTQKLVGTKVTFVSIPDTGHGMVALRAMPQLLTWLKTLP